MPSSFQTSTLRRVRAGAALLDKAMPGWAKKIKPEKLDLGSCTQCVLGQVYRGRGQDGFSRGVKKLGLTGRQEKSLGFNARDTMEWGARYEDADDYDRLDKAWLFEIGRRVNGRIRGA